VASVRDFQQKACRLANRTKHDKRTKLVRRGAAT